VADQAACKKVTVVIPAWNLGTELIESVESVVRQEVSPRVVVIDNASDRPLPRTNSETLRLSARRSVGAARNVGLRQADTEYVFFMDGDDILLPGALAHLIEPLEENADLVVSAGGIVLWDPVSQRKVPSYYPPRASYRLWRYPLAFALVNVWQNLLPTTGSALIRTAAARRVGGFADNNRFENWAFGVSLALCGPVRMSERPCKLYRVRPDLTSLTSQAVGRWDSAWYGRKEIRRRLRSHPSAPNFVRALAPLYLPLHAGQCVLALGRRPPRHMRVLGIDADG
jgi:glycosyltransferase involved in cell wall biosynthesis